LALLVIVIIGIMIVPVAPWILDLLLATNITLAITILMISLYLPNALSLASFPSILLVATLFRLALNVSSTRLILVHANAGTIIDSFGNFVVQGKYFVGFVIFLIITIIQFVVIAKGAERVSEVSARFTLDALPGKQMSIDADLRSGLIDGEQARKARHDLSRESQFYGAMDGAMKFVKGDAIAGILISIINISAGLAIGKLSEGMELADAAETYTLLTVGDGLVSQIPSLIIATAAAIITTRVASSPGEESSLGQEIGVQILAQPKAIAISGLMLIGFAVMPGLPFIPLATLGTLSGLLAWSVIRTRDKKDIEKIRAEVMGPQSITDGPARLPMAVPVILETSPQITPLVDVQVEGTRFIQELVPQMREWLFNDLGVYFPGVRVRGDTPHLSENSYRYSVNEVPVADGLAYTDRVFLPEGKEEATLLGIDGVGAPHPAGEGEGIWVSVQDAQQLSSLPGKTMKSDEYMAVHLATLLKRHVDQLLGIQDVQNMLELMENQGYGALVRSVVPGLVTVPRLSDILRRLLREDISIRNMRSIMESLAEWATYENDIVYLTEYVRMGLKDYIAHRFSGGREQLSVYLLDPRIEQAVRDGIQQSASGSSLSLEPESNRSLLEAFEAAIGDSSNGRPITIITQMDIRYFVRRFLEFRYPNLIVLSFQELPASQQIQPIGRVAFIERSLGEKAAG